MMKFIDRGFAFLFVAFLGLAGCSAYAQKKPDPNVVAEGGGEASSFQIRNGRIVPVSKNGKPFKVCSDGKRNTCSLFKENITLLEYETVLVTKFKHKINPTCAVYVIEFEGVQYGYYDETDPNCAQFNK